jgi:hypothetical protein
MWTNLTVSHFFRPVERRNTKTTKNQNQGRARAKERSLASSQFQLCLKIQFQRGATAPHRASNRGGDLWLANCYFSQDSSGFSALLRFFDAQSCRSFYPFHRRPGSLLGPGGVRSLIAESLLLKRQILILNRSRKLSPNLHASDRILDGLMALLARPTRLLRSAIALKPSTLLALHKSMSKGKYRITFEEPCVRGMPSLATKKVSPHTIRRSTATHLLRSGADINTVRDSLGHVSVDTTNIYARVDLETKAKAIAHCEPQLTKPAKRWSEDKGLMTFLQGL